MDFRSLYAPMAAGQHGLVDANALTLAQLLTYAALLAATCEYAEIIGRRQRGRVLVTQQAEIEQSGLQGLVRLFLADEDSVATRKSRRFVRRHRRRRRAA